MECLVAILPFFRKKGTAKEFSELITDQYGFLMVQLEKAMHAEIFSLREQRCRNTECELRK